MPLTFVLLLLSVAAVWLPAPRRAWPAAAPPWAVLYVLATGAAMVQGFVRWPGVAALAGLAALAWAAGRLRGPGLRAIAWAGLLVLCAALLLHRVPGFAPAAWLDGVRWSAQSPPFNKLLHFDKGAVGLLLVAFLAARRRTGGLLPGAGIGMATVLLVLGMALAAGLVRPDPKWSATLGLFLLVNLALTCVAEEAVFRLLVQDPLARRWGAACGVAVSALLFGLVHAGGGPWLVALASLSGLGAALAYAASGRIAVPIGVHFAVNAVHAIFFTYPALARG
ncbi:CPBP family intramembrane glutamic endopeptidase [Pseudorhodoferax sp.]|uniref:CPBP family intramembrane glutamic endopeptidase n=1 Tax=Pseudorhodoferax sp. TaxID=1993553 RepID=UPI002DD64CBA|nr:CPBP family intramembrane glutamic endopeptidase [Pseudorhodoferax sp.]